MVPNRRSAVPPEFEGETVTDWIRRQANPAKTPTPPRGITQPARATTAAMVSAITDKNAASQSCTSADGSIRKVEEKPDV